MEGNGTVSYTHLDVYKRQVRKSVTEQVLAAAGLGMTADQYDAAVAAGQVSEEVQACLLYTSRCV